MRRYEIGVILDPELEEHCRPSLETYLNVVRSEAAR